MCKVACEDQTKVIPCRVYEMNYFLNKKPNKQNVCTFFFYENTGQLLANITKHIHAKVKS